jgi:hypothetical protein
MDPMPTNMERVAEVQPPEADVQPQDAASTGAPTTSKSPASTRPCGCGTRGPHKTSCQQHPKHPNYPNNSKSPAIAEAK